MPPQRIHSSEVRTQAPPVVHRKLKHRRQDLLMNLKIFWKQDPLEVTKTGVQNKQQICSIRPVSDTYLPKYSPPSTLDSLS